MPGQSASDLIGRVRKEVSARTSRNRFVDLLEAARVPQERLTWLAGEQFRIVGSDQRSFALLAARFPQPPASEMFLSLAQGELGALRLLSDFAAALGWDEQDLRATSRGRSRRHARRISRGARCSGPAAGSRWRCWPTFRSGADDLRPVQWPADAELEWCPPGHGDIYFYFALAASGTLDALLGAGLRYAFVSNSDNLGALADVRIAAWLAAEQVPFALEAVRGTPADRKGGHLARYQGRVVLRETAQVPDGDTSFTDVERWRWYNTNNIWIDLRALQDLQAADPAAPDPPLILNRKRVDPRDPASTPVIQLESAMGAAIGSIPGARAVHVPRSRFAPVKSTDDLLVVRSDAYELTSDGQMRPGFDGPAPVVTLDKDCYELLPGFEQRFPAGAPSLRRCRRFEVDGDVTFGAGVIAVGNVRVTGPRHIPDGEVLGG